MQGCRRISPGPLVVASKRESLHGNRALKQVRATPPCCLPPFPLFFHSSTLLRGRAPFFEVGAFFCMHRARLLIDGVERPLNTSPCRGPFDRSTPPPLRRQFCSSPKTLVHPQASSCATESNTSQRLSRYARVRIPRVPAGRRTLMSTSVLQNGSGGYVCSFASR